MMTIIIVFVFITLSFGEALKLNMKTSSSAAAAVTKPMINPLESIISMNTLAKMQTSVPKYKVSLESEVAALKASGMCNILNFYFKEISPYFMIMCRRWSS